MHADRTNRFALTLFGLLVLLTGAAGMIASTGVFGTGFSRRTLFANRVSAYIGHHGTWVWAAAAGACLLIALAALRWILALLISTDRAGDIPIPSAREGTTILQPPPSPRHHPKSGPITASIPPGRIIGDASDPASSSPYRQPVSRSAPCTSASNRSPRPPGTHSAKLTCRSSSLASAAEPPDRRASGLPFIAVARLGSSPRPRDHSSRSATARLIVRAGEYFSARIRRSR
jgi:hypothetical protein